MDPTDEQSHILSLARDTRANLMISALAGCGKTTTLELIEKAQPDKPVLYCAFNKKIADDATPRMATTTTVRTFNSLGHRIWAQAVNKKIALDTKKPANILREIISEARNDRRGRIWDQFWNIVTGVNMARALGYIPHTHAFAERSLVKNIEDHLEETPDDFVLDLIDQVLLRGIAQSYAGTIDFNDQIYMPTLFGGNFPRFPLVMVDEYQDLNPINHAMIAKLARARLIGVGDPFQNIYGFRGAAARGMSDAAERYTMTPCDLSVSFRCPRRIVENVHWRAPNMRWVKEGGAVSALESLHATAIRETATFICRNNAPLYRVAMGLLASGRSVSVSGSDIGPKVLAQMKRLGPADTDQPSTLAAIDDWLAEKLAKGSKTAEDTAECMRVFSRNAPTLSSAMAYAEHLFAQKGKIQFTTGHKAKGLEWNTVYHLDPWLLGDDEQDQNLRYVISTRSADTLYEVNSANIKY